MNLVEIIPAASTPPETICRAVELCRKINKTPIVVKDSCGFLVNRIFARYMDEACRMLESAAGDILKIDLELSHNLMLKGPYHIADFIGLDVLLKTNENLYRYYSGGKDNKFRVAQSLVELCKRGRYGCKVGRGYYSYAKPGAEAEIDEELTEILKEIQKNSSLSYVPINKEIALLAMINEAFLCLEEGIVRGADNIDLAMKYGFGMFEGPIGLARQIGIKRIYKRLDDLRDQYGERFSPAPLLKDFA